MEKLGTTDRVTIDLLGKVLTLRWQDGPSDLLIVVKQCLLDWLGVSIAAADDPPVQILRRQLEEQGGHPQAFVFGRTQRLNVQRAAL